MGTTEVPPRPVTKIRVTKVKVTVQGGSSPGWALLLQGQLAIRGKCSTPLHITEHLPRPSPQGLSRSYAVCEEDQEHSSEASGLSEVTLFKAVQFTLVLPIHRLQTKYKESKEVWQQGFITKEQSSSYCDCYRVNK